MLQSFSRSEVFWGALILTCLTLLYWQARRPPLHLERHPPIHMKPRSLSTNGLTDCACPALLPKISPL